MRVNDLTRDIDNFQCAHESKAPSFFAVDSRHATGCGKYIHPRTGRREYHSRK